MNTTITLNEKEVQLLENIILYCYLDNTKPSMIEMETHMNYEDFVKDLHNNKKKSSILSSMLDLLNKIDGVDDL